MTAGLMRFVLVCTACCVGAAIARLAAIRKRMVDSRMKGRDCSGPDLPVVSDQPRATIEVLFTNPRSPVRVDEWWESLGDLRGVVDIRMVSIGLYPNDVAKGFSIKVPKGPKQSAVLTSLVFGEVNLGGAFEARIVEP